MQVLESLEWLDDRIYTIQNQSMHTDKDRHVVFDERVKVYETLRARLLVAHPELAAIAEVLVYGQDEKLAQWLEENKPQ